MRQPLLGSAVDCRLLNFADETLTGGSDTFTGVALGYVVTGTPGDSATIRCYVAVNGGEVASTPVMGGTSIAVTAGQVTYTATDTDFVALCAETTTGSDSATTCFSTFTQQVIPDPVLELAESLAQTVADADGMSGNCTVNLGSCTGGTCFVNLGSCDRGTCFVNVGTCDGGTCFVNGGVCRAKVDPR